MQNLPPDKLHPLDPPMTPDQVQRQRVRECQKIVATLQDSKQPALLIGSMVTRHELARWKIAVESQSGLAVPSESVELIVCPWLEGYQIIAVDAVALRSAVAELAHKFDRKYPAKLGGTDAQPGSELPG